MPLSRQRSRSASRISSPEGCRRGDVSSRTMTEPAAAVPGVTDAAPTSASDALNHEIDDVLEDGVPDDDVLSWLRLSLVRGVGPRTAAKLLESFASPSGIFGRSASELLTAKIR